MTYFHKTDPVEYRKNMVRLVTKHYNHLKLPELCTLIDKTPDFINEVLGLKINGFQTVGTQVEFIESDYFKALPIDEQNLYKAGGCLDCMTMTCDGKCCVGAFSLKAIGKKHGKEK